nr:hypothetical protein [Tanacetum cinerariifolium]
MPKGGSRHQVSGGKVVGGGHEYQGGTGASVVKVTRETVEIKKDTKDAKQRRGGKFCSAMAFFLDWGSDTCSFMGLNGIKGADL